VSEPGGRPPATDDAAATFARWLDADPDWERAAPVSSGSVLFRLRPRDWAADDSRLDALNAGLREAVNATGEVFLSHAVLGSRYVLRLVIGRGRSDRGHVARAWAILRAEALRLGVTPPIVA
jgi:aromatic-L-amino-acid/L-tryptophan decarboxylase